VLSASAGGPEIASARRSWPDIAHSISRSGRGAGGPGIGWQHRAAAMAM